MNYYPFHLGDYAAHTGHLSPLEDLAYRRMIDLYYLRECPLPADWREVARLIRLRDNGTEIESVLSEFFNLSDSGWSHVRCDAEITKMHDKQTKARASAEASVRARSASAQRTLNERSTNAELPTPTPTPTPTPVGEMAVAPAQPRKRASKVVPQDFEVTDEMLSWARASHPSVDLQTQTSAFRDHEFKDPKTDWVKAWRNWIRRSDSMPGVSRPGLAPNRQEAIEARNAAAGDEWLRQQGIEA